MLLSQLGLSGRRLWIGIGVLVMIIAALLLLNITARDNSKPLRPILPIMSSLALQWGEATMEDIVAGKAEPSPLLERLSERIKPILIDDFQKLGGVESRPLLLIQPRALAPRELVQLDRWIRDGGGAIIFADPALDWPSDLPLGDTRRPLFTSLLTPMFRHWGVELALPVAEDVSVDAATIGNHRVAPKSPGIWLRAENGKPSASCRIRTDELMALCRVGKGQALMIADVDLLHEDRWTDNVLRAGTVGWLEEVIVAMRSKGPLPDRLWENAG
jgi:hypothetical protein